MSAMCPMSIGSENCFLQDDSRSAKMLTVIDEYSRECLAIVTERSLKSDDVLALTCS